MATNTEIIVFGAIGVLAIISAVMFIGNLADTSDTPSTPTRNVVEYDYEYYSVPSFTSDFGYVYTPDPGYKYVIVKIRAHNVNFEEFKTDYIAWEWEIVYNGTVHSTTFEMFSHPDYQAPSLLPGGSADLVRVFTIPNNVAVEDVKFRSSYLSLYGNPNLVFTPTLI